MRYPAVSSNRNLSARAKPRKFVAYSCNNGWLYVTNQTPAFSLGSLSVGKSLLTDLTKLRPPFDDVPIEQEDYGKKLDHEWKLHKVSGASADGYDGALFSTEINGKPHYVIYHQGTNNFRDSPSIASIADGKEPQQVADARKFVQEAEDIIAANHPQQDATLIHSGYSLGGALAILTSGKGQPVITLDAPGTRNIARKMGLDVAELDSRVLEVLSPHPNYVNSHGAHVGQILAAGEKFLNRERNGRKVSVGDFMQYGWQSHRIRNIGLGLASLQQLDTTPATETAHPQDVFAAFRMYLDDNMGENPSLGERALSFTAKLLDTLWLDKLATKLVAGTASRVTGNMDRKLREGTDSYPSPQTHSAVQLIVPPQPQPEQEQVAVAEQDTAQQAGFAEKLLQSRQNAQNAQEQGHGQGIG